MADAKRQPSETVRADEIKAGDFLPADDGRDHMVVKTTDLITGRIKIWVDIIGGRSYTRSYTPDAMIDVRIF